MASRAMAVAWFLATQGCANQKAVTKVGPCPYSEGDSVELTDTTVLGFSPADVIEAASVAAAGTAAVGPGEQEVWWVSLVHEFSVVGGAMSVNFGVSDDPFCPVGSALLVPVTYKVSGTIESWAIQSSAEGLALVATAGTLEAVSGFNLSYDGDTFNAEVDDAFEAEVHMRQMMSSSVPTDCALDFALSPWPLEKAAGGWKAEL